MTDQPILLKTLLTQRHWQTYSTFCKEYDTALRPGASHGAGVSRGIAMADPTVPNQLADRRRPAASLDEPTSSFRRGALLLDSVRIVLPS